MKSINVLLKKELYVKFELLSYVQYIEMYYNKNIEDIGVKFPASNHLYSSCLDIKEVTQKYNSILILNNCIGIFGIQGSLPYKSDRLIRQSEVLRKFLNIFNHQFVLLFYQLYKHEFYLPKNICLYKYLWNDSIQDDIPIKLRIYFGCGVRKINAIEQILYYYLSYDVDIKVSFVSAWNVIDDTLCVGDVLDVSYIGKRMLNQIASMHIIVLAYTEKQASLFDKYYNKILLVLQYYIGKSFSVSLELKLIQAFAKLILSKDKLEPGYVL